MTMVNRNTIACPHCDGRVRTQTSRALSTLVREIYYECVDVDCGHRFVAQLGITRTLVESLKPKPGVQIHIVDRRANDIVVASSPAPATAPAPSQPHAPVLAPNPPPIARRPPPMMLN